MSCSDITLAPNVKAAAMARPGDSSVTEAAQMRTIVLLSCVKTKRSHPSPAKDIRSATRVSPASALGERVVPAIKQALSMLRQVRETLFFAQCPAAVANVRQAIKSSEGALRSYAEL